MSAELGGMLVIRRAQPDDAEAWHALLDAVASEGRWIGREAPVARDDAAFVARLDRTDATTFVAEIDGTLVGSLNADDWRGVVSFGMWVAPDARGRRVGRALLDACLAWSNDVGAHKVSLEVWPHNDAAIHLYRSAGFEIEGRKRRHYRRSNGELWDSLLMGKVLDTESPSSAFPDAPSLHAPRRP